MAPRSLCIEDHHVIYIIPSHLLITRLTIIADTTQYDIHSTSRNNSQLSPSTQTEQAKGTAKWLEQPDRSQQRRQTRRPLQLRRRSVRFGSWRRLSPQRFAS
jgi:hypothetical protein